MAHDAVLFAETIVALDAVCEVVERAETGLTAETAVHTGNVATRAAMATPTLRATRRGWDRADSGFVKSSVPGTG